MGDIALHPEERLEMNVQGSLPAVQAAHVGETARTPRTCGHRVDGPQAAVPDKCIVIAQRHRAAGAAAKRSR